MTPEQVDGITAFYVPLKVLFLVEYSMAGIFKGYHSYDLTMKCGCLVYISNPWLALEQSIAQLRLDLSLQLIHTHPSPSFHLIPQLFSISSLLDCKFIPGKCIHQIISFFKLKYCGEGKKRKDERDWLVEEKNKGIVVQRFKLLIMMLASHIRAPVQVLSALLPLQLLYNAPGKAAYDSPITGGSTPNRETRMEFLSPSFYWARAWLLLPFGEWQS